MTYSYTGTKTLTYSMINNIPSGEVVSLDAATGEFEWIPSMQANGVYNVRFRVTDGILFDSKTMTITVANLDFTTWGACDADTADVVNVDGGTISVSNTGIYTKHQIYIPPNALGGTSETIVVGPPSTDDISAEELENVPSAVDFSVPGYDNYTFADSVYLTIEFKRFEVRNNINNMRGHRWNRLRRIWKRVGGKHIINLEDGTAEFPVDGLSIYAVIEVTDTTNIKSITPGWNMIGVPVETESPNDPQTIFSDDISPFRFESGNSNIYEYNEVSGGWTLPSTIQYWNGYILYGFFPANVDVSGLEITSDFTRSLSYTNNNGWHLAGNPYAENVEWETDIVPDANISSTFYRWTGRQYEYYPGGGLTATISPWQGFWVRAEQNGAELDFIYPGTSTPKRAVNVNNIPLRIQIKAESGNLQDIHNYIGISEQAIDEYDAYDVFELVPLDDEFISVYFPHGEWNNPGNYTQDIRKALDETTTWQMNVLSRSNTDIVTLTWSIPDEFYSDYDVILTTGGEKSINMRESDSYSYSVIPVIPKTSAPRLSISNDPGNFMSKLSDDGVTEKSFTLILNKAEESNSLVPDEYYLKQNYPNPFNPTTTIEYGLIQAGHVSLKIYNTLGQEIRTLVNTQQGAGEYRVIWDGVNNAGRSVASGVYLSRISSGTFTSIKKLILLR
ncbi:FlgD immunoglobulin-like domain containing protein [candidate division KSB1 bacterium]